jgi:hypothetical protein
MSLLGLVVLIGGVWSLLLICVIGLCMAVKHAEIAASA